MRSKPFLKLMLVVAVLVGVQIGLFTPESALAAPCCQSCEPGYASCTSNCNSTCGSNQSCLNTCYQDCDAAEIRCMRSCVWCSGGGGGGWPCCYPDWTGYCPAECSYCVTC